MPLTNQNEKLFLTNILHFKIDLRSLILNRDFTERHNTVVDKKKNEYPSKKNIKNMPTVRI